MNAITGIKNIVSNLQNQRARETAVAKILDEEFSTAQKELTTTIANESKIPEEIAAARVKVYKRGKRSAHERTLWMGSQAINAKKLGNATAVAGGTTVGGRFFPGAFVVKKLNNHLFRRKTLASLPIERVFVDISLLAHRSAINSFDNLEKKISDRLEKEITNQLAGAL